MDVTSFIDDAHKDGNFKNTFLDYFSFTEIDSFSDHSKIRDIVARKSL